MSIAANPDLEKQSNDITKSLLNTLIDKGIDDNKSSSKYFNLLIEECVKFANNKDIYSVDNQHFSNVLFLVNETENGLEYFKNLDLAKIDISVYKQLLLFFEEWKTSFEKQQIYRKEELDKYARLQAEFDNYKKRVHKEKTIFESQIKYNTISGMLDIIDDLELSKKNEPDNEGVQLISAKLKKFIESQGIEEVDCDCEFDANKHECITVVNMGEEKYNKIIEVVSKGYSINGNIVRYPKVIVSK